MQLFETWQSSLPIVIFGIAIAGGAVTAFARLTDRNTPVDTGLLHGRIGVVGIVLMLAVMFTGDVAGMAVSVATGLFVLTAIFGVALYFIIRRKGILPKAVIFIHGLLAVTALLILLS